ncbi:MAG TPA: type II toxin-antitoxin system Phd/YefM family antitoxin [Planctomycetota bacterium]|nr:type II toxin-antitoxin system Phd/YefM family antitoxin [Planctomycetota bacterium]
MKRVGAFDAKTHFSQLLTEVERTQRSIVIQRRGKDVAALVPARNAVARSDAERAKWVVSELQAIRARQKKGGPRLRAEDLIEEGRKR